MLEPHNKEIQRKLESDLRELIDERNSVFHEGRVNSFSPEYLRSSAHILSRQILHQIRLKIKSDNFETKDDINQWIQAQYQKYLR